MLSYCLKCRKIAESKNPNVVKVKKLMDCLVGIKTPLSKITLVGPILI